MTDGRPSGPREEPRTGTGVPRLSLGSILHSIPAWTNYAILRLARRRFRRFRPDEFRADAVYCIGSGPSLDLFDATAVRNATILLLNGAVDAAGQFHASNRLVWLCQDTGALLSTYRRVPATMDRIVTVHAYEQAFRVLSTLSRRDIFFLPGPVFRPKYPTKGEPPGRRLYLRPRLAGYGGAPIVLRTLDDASVYPVSVMLLAIAIALMIARQDIHLVGFDMGHGPAENGYAKLVGSQSSTSPDRYPETAIKTYLDAFREEATQRGLSLFQHSPYAPKMM